MNRKTTLASLGLAAVTVSALGVGTALASTHAPAAASNSSTTVPAADVPTPGDKPDSTTATRLAGTGTSVPVAENTDPATPGDQADNASTADKPDAPEAAGSETADGSDGPGGHADQNSNADTQQEGQH